MSDQAEKLRQLARAQQASSATATHLLTGGSAATELKALALLPQTNRTSSQGPCSLGGEGTPPCGWESPRHRPFAHRGTSCAEPDHRRLINGQMVRNARTSIVQALPCGGRDSDRTAITGIEP
jgi:hypothetical protein